MPWSFGADCRKGLPGTAGRHSRAKLSAAMSASRLSQAQATNSCDWAMPVARRLSRVRCFVLRGQGQEPFAPAGVEHEDVAGPEA